MRRRQSLKNKRLLAGPYLLWAVSFVVIPLLMIFYYGMTTETGSFTWDNIARTASGFRQHRYLPASGLSAGNDIVPEKCEPVQLYRADFHSPHVDELPAAHLGMADFVGKNRRY